ncbi:MAG: hypothetical protein WA642_04375 [Steroidobacteraceae bacterium]
MRYMVSWLSAAGCLAMLTAGASTAAPRLSAAGAEQLQAAERLYRQGVLPSGQPLVAEREDAKPMQGGAAACVNCHLRSGLGTVEGRILIPPITAKYLFRPAATMAQPPTSARGPMRSRYTAATLARAIREGIDPDGRRFNYLMPRYALDEASMSAMIDYLRRLGRGPVPGVGGETLDFATIITPDANPTERQGMLDVLGHCFGANDAPVADQAPQQRAGMRIPAGHRWQLHIWELTGPSEGWEQQLRQHFAAQPVFAVISGLGRETWAPVHRFCQEHAVPCLLPNVDLPVVAEDDFYPVYFSKGVLLEAQIFASRLQPQAQSAARHVIQVFRADDIGSAGAAALQQASAASGLQWREHPLQPNASASDLVQALHEAEPMDAIVLWLRPHDLKELPETPPPGAAVFISGLMADLEQAPLPPAWRNVARMSYPFELPGLRALGMGFAQGWFGYYRIPVLAERVQTDTYLACEILAEAAGHMVNNWVPDRLVELVEIELGHRLVNGYYPRLGLAPGQRFASKGGYLARYEDASGTRLVADGDWIVP